MRRTLSKAGGGSRLVVRIAVVRPSRRRKHDAVDPAAASRIIRTAVIASPPTSVSSMPDGDVWRTSPIQYSIEASTRDGINHVGLLVQGHGAQGARRFGDAIAPRRLGATDLPAGRRACPAPFGRRVDGTRPATRLGEPSSDDGTRTDSCQPRSTTAATRPC